MNTQDNQSDLSNTQPTDTWQKFNNKKFIFIGLGLILVIFLAILSFVPPEKSLEVKISPTPPPATPTIRAPRVEDQVILKFKEGVTEAQINERLKQYNATIVEKVYGSDLILVNVAEGQGDAMLDAFEKDNLVEQAQPNYIYEATSNDFSYNLQWGLKNTGVTIGGKKGTPNADINVEAAWAVTKGNGVKIAILDTGADVKHIDLSSKIVAQKDFTGDGINDVGGHGTHVAGIVAAATDNTIGVAGTCPQCQLVIVKTLSNSGRGTSSSIVSSINWAADPNQGGAKVISMSFAGGGGGDAEQKAINDAWAKGVVIVAAASNEGDTVKKYPGAYTNVVSVAATDNNDKMASFSTHGTWVTVAAPGASIFSTLPGNKYDYLSGTSMATPMTSGVVGLILASNPGITNADAVKRLCDTADKIAGTGTNWTCGRINAGKAVGTVPITNPVSLAPSLIVVQPTFNCLGGNPCTSPMPSPVASPGTPPNQPPALSGPVTSIQPTNINQPVNPIPSINGPIINPPTNPNSELSKVFCYVILLLVKLLGIDLNALGIDLGKTCGNI